MTKFKNLFENRNPKWTIQVNVHTKSEKFTIWVFRPGDVSNVYMVKGKNKIDGQRPSLENILPDKSDYKDFGNKIGGALITAESMGTPEKIEKAVRVMLLNSAATVDEVIITPWKEA